MAEVPLPVGVSFLGWARALVTNFPQLPEPPRVYNEAAWRGWAMELKASPQLAEVGVPGPEGFADWQAWAQPFTQSLEAAEL